MHLARGVEQRHGGVGLVDDDLAAFGSGADRFDVGHDDLLAGAVELLAGIELQQQVGADVELLAERFRRR